MQSIFIYSIQEDENTTLTSPNYFFLTGTGQNKWHLKCGLGKHTHWFVMIQFLKLGDAVRHGYYDNSVAED